MVEAIIVSGLLVTMMGAGLFLHRVYAAKHRALQDARLAAWLKSNDCHSAIDMGAVWTQTGLAGEPMDVETQSLPGFFGAVGHTTGSASHQAAANSRGAGGDRTLSASHTVACNEVSQDKRGDAASLLGYMTSNLVPTL